MLNNNHLDVILVTGNNHSVIQKLFKLFLCNYFIQLNQNIMSWFSLSFFSLWFLLVHRSYQLHSQRICFKKCNAFHSPSTFSSSPFTSNLRVVHWGKQFRRQSRTVNQHQQCTFHQELDKQYSCYSWSVMRLIHNMVRRLLGSRRPFLYTAIYL